jgi:hypothetical protein
MHWFLTFIFGMELYNTVLLFQPMHNLYTLKTLKSHIKTLNLYTLKTLKSHIKTINICPYMFRSLMEPSSGGS